MPAIRYEDLLLRIVKEITYIRSALRHVTTNLPLYDIASENTPAQLTANQNNYAPGNYDVLRLSSSLAVSITGIRGGVKGRSLRIFNTGAYAITLAHQNASSDAANRLKFATAANVLIMPGSFVDLYYDSSQSRWVEGMQLEDSGISKETTPAQITANQNNYNPSDYGVLRITSSAAYSITGISGGVKGRSLRIFNVGSYEITLSHQSASSDAANRVVTGTGQNLVIGAGGWVDLYYDSTSSRWRAAGLGGATSGDKSNVKLSLSANLSIPDTPPAPETTIEWSSEDVDTDGYFNALNPGYITIQFTGWYFVNIQIQWTQNATGYRSIAFDATSFPFPIYDTRGAVNGNPTISSIGKMAYLNKGDTVTVLVLQNSGGALDIDDEKTFFEVLRMD